MANQPIKTTGDLIPKSNDAYNLIRNHLLEEGTVDEKTLEMMILTHAIAVKCERCIYAHMKILVQLGATEQDIATCAGVGMLMGGGPGRQFGNMALEAYYKYAKKDS